MGNTTSKLMMNRWQRGLYLLHSVPEGLGISIMNQNTELGKNIRYCQSDYQYRIVPGEYIVKDW